MSKNNQCPEDIDYLRLDVIAECYNGVSDALYRKLWELTAESEQAGTSQPLGGDGSNGTTEIPIVGGNYSNVLGKAWSRFTVAEQAEIVKVTRLDW